MSDLEAGEAPPELAIDHAWAGSLLAVTAVACRARPSGPGGEEGVASARFILPRRGLFRFHVQEQTLLADPHAAFLMDPADGYRVSHPVAGGDDCLVLAPTPEVLDQLPGSPSWLDLSGGRVRFRRTWLQRSPGAQWALASLHRSLGDPGLATEEAALGVLEALAASPGQGWVDPGAQARYVDRARLFLASAPEEAHSLEAIGKAAHCSPFHLARAFRQATGGTLHQYQTRLRLGSALDRLAQGEMDLSRLAVDLGFASHSHFTARFRSVFGLTPRAAREALTGAGLGHFRRILTAASGES